MGERVHWGVWMDKEGDHGEPRWFEDHRGYPKSHEEEHARAMADTLNRGGMTGICEARPLPESSCEHGSPACQSCERAHLRGTLRAYVGRRGY